MSDDLVSKHIRFNQVHIDIMNELIANQPGVTNYAEAVRFSLLALKDPLENGEKVQSKINAMSKKIDMLTEMVAGGFHEQGINDIVNSKKTNIYKDAKKFVEKDIQRSITIKSNPKQSLNREEKKSAYSSNFV